jgi:hypothetical protein
MGIGFTPELIRLLLESGCSFLIDMATEITTFGIHLSRTLDFPAIVKLNLDIRPMLY